MTLGSRTDIPGFTPIALLRPDAFSHPVTHLELRETHLSWVLLTGPFAYKFKKSVHFDFIDASTLERRHVLCTEELRLNRRFAAELYVDVQPIVFRDGKFALGGAGEVVEYAVRMRQFSPDDELSSLVRARKVSRTEMAEFGARLGEFHGRAERATRLSATQMLAWHRKWVLGNVAYLRDRMRSDGHAAAVNLLFEWTQSKLQALEHALADRLRFEHIRECHGDLHSGNVVRFNRRLMPFDCLEFNAELRWIDVLDDVAFLYMDLISLDRPDLASTVLDSYLAVTGDYSGLCVLRYYAVYRALVRAKVDAIAQESIPKQEADRSSRLVHRLDIARQLAAPSSQRLIVLMHGLSGSGKSWLSEALLADLPAIRIRSDIERKRLHAAQDAELGMYSAELSRRTYLRLRQCAEDCVESGFNAIVDATFLDPNERQTFRELAIRLNAQFAIVDCQAPHSVLTERIKRRQAERRDVSDADLAVLRQQLSAPHELTRAEEALAIVARTEHATVVDDTLSALRKRLAQRGPANQS